jgi:hypothetical protein
MEAAQPSIKAGAGFGPAPISQYRLLAYNFARLRIMKVS